MGPQAPAPAPSMLDALDAIAHAFPYPAFLVDTAGLLRWSSVEGTRRFGSPEPSGRVPGPLETLLRCARACLADPAECPDRLLRAAGLLRPGERATARRYVGAGGDLVLVALAPALAAETPASAPRPPSPLLEQGIPGLTPAEAAVARLAVEGCSVATISARLGSSESTVRTHLRRIYRKLRVHGRAELAFVLLHGLVAAGKVPP